MDQTKHYLVTGAGGFIGGWMAETIFLQKQHNVRAGLHRWAGAARLSRFQMDLAICDIMNPDQLDQVMDGITHVIHCAKGPSPESMINGTRNVIDAAARRGVKHVVHLSTAEVYGNPTGIVDETHALVKTGNPYADAKLEAEQVCAEYIQKGYPLSIVRPSIVYGPFSKTWSVSIGEKLKSGNWGIFKGNGDGICNLIYVSDLVKEVLSISQNERAIGQSYNLNGPDRLTWNEYFARFNDALGLPALKVIEPESAKMKASIIDPMRTAAKFARDHFEKQIKSLAASFSPAKSAMKYLEGIIKSAPRMVDFDLFNRNAVYPDDKVRDLLGYQPQVNLDTGLSLTVAWMKQVGLIKE